jgi:hypothetical protein
MTRVRDHGTPEIRLHHDSLASAFTGAGRDELLRTLHLCLQGERVFTSDLRREIAARGVDLESLALSVPPATDALRAP